MGEFNMVDLQQEKKVFTFSDGKNMFDYTLVNYLGEGAVGRVFRVREIISRKEDEITYGGDYALKLWLRGDKDKFRQNSSELQKTTLDHFIPVYKVGNLPSDTEDDGQDNFEAENKTQNPGIPAIVMKYGGMNLDALVKTVLPTVDAKIAEAVKYKVMFTVLEGLENAHKKKMYHADLNPKNILTGVDSELSGSELEQALLYGHVMLCDRDAKGIGTFSTSRPSLSYDDLMLSLYFCDTLEGSSALDKDIFSAMALASWLFNGRKLRVADYVRTELGIDLVTTTDVSIKAVRTSFKKKCADKLNYFIETKATNGHFPVVLRPLDMFINYLGQKVSYTRDELEQVYATDGCSFTKLRERGISATEKMGFNTAFAAYLEKAIAVLSERKEKKLLDANPFIQQLNDSQKSLDDCINNKAQKEIELTGCKGKHTEYLLTIQNGDYSVETAEKLMVNSKYIAATTTEINDLEQDIILKQQEVDSSQNDLKRYDYASEDTSLGYIRETCVENLPTELKNQVVSKIG